eukprot:5977342-Pleurochrysis_carterae.AAC.1
MESPTATTWLRLQLQPQISRLVMGWVMAKGMMGLIRKRRKRRGGNCSCCSLEAGSWRSDFLQGVEAYVWSVRKNVGLVFDDVSAPWQGFTREDVYGDAGLINDPGEEEWLVRYASSPIEVAKLPVQAVVLGSVGRGGDGTRGPAGTL